MEWTTPAFEVLYSQQLCKVSRKLLFTSYFQVFPQPRNQNAIKLSTPSLPYNIWSISHETIYIFFFCFVFKITLNKWEYC